MTNSVTFPVALGGNGSTVTDDAAAATGLDNGGHRTRLVPMFGQAVNIAQFIANIGTNVYSAPGTNGSSTTNLTVGTGTQSLTIQTGKSLYPGQTVVIALTATPSTQMVGTVTSYNSGTGALVVEVSSVSGSGTGAAWQVALSGRTGAAGSITMPRLAPVANLTLTQADNGKLVQCSGTFTLSVSTLSAGWMTVVENISGGAITIPSADGLTNWLMYPSESRVFQYDGTQLRSVVIMPFYLVTTTTLSFIVPPGYSALGYDLVGAGGGGGSGRRGATSTLRLGGAPGGAAARVRGEVLGLIAGAPKTLGVGAAGVGAAAVTIDSTDGGNGTAGGSSWFDVHASASGGQGGLGGNSVAGGTTSGSGSKGVGVSARSGTQGGLPSSINNDIGSVNNPDSLDNGGAGAKNTAADGGCSVWGGAGSAGSSIATIGAGGSSINGVPAGGIGGLVTAGNSASGGGTAGAAGSYTPGGGASGGASGITPSAGSPGTAAASDNAVGTSGGGGGSSTSALPAGAGGGGAAPGGAGGGGGASANGTSSGGGGNGATGRVIVWGIA